MHWNDLQIEIAFSNVSWRKNNEQCWISAMHIAHGIQFCSTCNQVTQRVTLQRLCVIALVNTFQTCIQGVINCMLKNHFLRRIKILSTLVQPRNLLNKLNVAFKVTSAINPFPSHDRKIWTLFASKITSNTKIELKIYNKS